VLLPLANSGNRCPLTHTCTQTHTHTHMHTHVHAHTTHTSCLHAPVVLTRTGMVLCLQGCSTVSPNPLALVNCVAHTCRLLKQMSTHTHMHTYTHTYNTRRLSPCVRSYRKRTKMVQVFSPNPLTLVNCVAPSCRLLQQASTHTHTHTNTHMYTHVHHTQAVSTLQWFQQGLGWRNVHGAATLPHPTLPSRSTHSSGPV